MTKVVKQKHCYKKKSPYKVKFKKKLKKNKVKITAINLK